MNSAEFRAYTGVMQLPTSWLAEKFDVQARTVNRWGKEDNVPDDVDLEIRRYYDIFLDMVSEKYEDLMDSTPEGERVTLYLVREKATGYNASDENKLVLPAPMVNAIVGQVALLLTLEDVEVDFKFA